MLNYIGAMRYGLQRLTSFFCAAATCCTSRYCICRIISNVTSKPIMIDCRLYAILGHGKTGFFLHGIIEVSEQATETARRILKMREEHRNGITKTLGYAAGNGHRVLETLYEKPIVSVKDVEAVIGTSFAAANQLVKRLEEMGLLEESPAEPGIAFSAMRPISSSFRIMKPKYPEPLE